MAIQVRLDLTPQEFDLMRAALETHSTVQHRRIEDGNLPASERRDARAEVARVTDLLAKVR